MSIYKPLHAFIDDKTKSQQKTPKSQQTQYFIKNQGTRNVTHHIYAFDGPEKEKPNTFLFEEAQIPIPE